MCKNNKQVYKAFDSEPSFDNFDLHPIKDVYSSFISGEEVYFLDSFNEPVKVVSIVEEEYRNGMIKTAPATSNNMSFGLPNLSVLNFKYRLWTTILNEFYRNGIRYKV